MDQGPGQAAGAAGSARQDPVLAGDTALPENAACPGSATAASSCPLACLVSHLSKYLGSAQVCAWSFTSPRRIAAVASL